MEKLQELSQSELQELLDNAERVEAMALESDEIQNIQLEREMALAANRSLAEQNLDRKPYLESQREALVSRYLQLEAVQQKYREHCAQRDGMEGQVSPEALFNRLQVESSKTEEESESLADEFLDGSLALDSFLDRFLSLRSLAHKRRVRIEKLQEVLRQRNSASSTATDKPDPASSTHHAPNTSNNHLPHPKPAAAPPALPPPGLPYSPYPVSAPHPAAPSATAAAAAATGPSNPPTQFPPYPSAGSSFTPAAGYSGVPTRPAFGPLPPPPPQPQQSGGSCPYPVQPSAFTGPHPGSAFGQYTPSSGAAPYPASYSYGGYSYPGGPPYNNTQSPTGRPMYRPGYGVPQPYS